MRETGSRAFVRAALSLDVTAQLRETQREYAIRTAKIKHKEQQEQSSIKSKRNTVLRSPQPMKEKFIKQMEDNQKHGIYMEDPAVTLELLNSEEHLRFMQQQIKRGEKSIGAFVDQILSQSQVKVKGSTDGEEIHLSPRMRYATLDPKEFVKE